VVFWRSDDPSGSETQHPEPDYQRVARVALLQQSLHCRVLRGILRRWRHIDLHGVYGRSFAGHCHETHGSHTRASFGQNFLSGITVVFWIIGKYVELIFGFKVLNGLQYLKDKLQILHRGFL